MPCVIRKRNISLSARHSSRMSVMLLSATLIFSATIVATARTGQSTSIGQHLARFNFTGTFRFKPKPLIEQPSRQFRSAQSIIVAMADTPNTQTKSLPLRIIAPQVIIAPEVDLPKKTLTQASAAPSVIEAGTNQKTRNFGKNTLELPKPGTSNRTPILKPSRSLAPKPNGQPIVVASPSAVVAVPKSEVASVTKIQVIEKVQATEKVQVREPSPERVTPTLKPAPTTTSSRQIAASVQSVQPSPSKKPPALSPQSEQPSEVARVENVLSRANRSSLGANVIETKVEAVSVVTNVPRTNHRANDAPMHTQTIANEAIPSKAAPKADIKQVASATPAKTTVSSEQAPVTRSERRAQIPPLPSIYHRPATTKRKRRAAVKKKVAKAAVARKKAQSKPKAASNWLSAAPRWANGAFKSE